MAGSGGKRDRGKGRGWLAVAVVFFAVVAVAGWWWWPREDKLGDVLQLQQKLLAGDARRGDIDRVIRTIDRMDRDDIRAAYRAAGASWKAIEQSAIDAYFAADAAERPQLLDEHLDRLATFHELLVAMNPRSRPDGAAFMPGRRRRGRGSGGTPAAAKPATPADDAARQLRDRFTAALATRARSLGRPLPEFR